MKTFSNLETNCTITILNRNQKTKIQGGSFKPLGTKVEAKTKESTTPLG